MKKVALVFIGFALASICVVSYAQEKKDAAAKGTKTIVVPKGKTYITLDKHKKEIGRYGSGQRLGITDCAIIDCPSTFPKDFVCWQCKERPAAAKAQ